MPPIAEGEATFGQAEFGSDTARIPLQLAIRQSTRAVSLDAELLSLTSEDTTGGAVAPPQFAPAPYLTVNFQ